MNYTGYWIGIGIELFVIVICTVLLILMLTGVLFTWIVKGKERAAERKEKREEERARKEAERAARAEAEAAAAAEEAELEEEAEEEEETEEEVAEEKPAEEVAEAKPQPKAEAKSETKSEVKSEATETEETEETETKKIKKKKVKKVEEVTEESEEQVAVSAEDDGNGAVTFGESKTITELYEELSAEQKGYFDELREEALTKPNAELSISRNFVTVKIGKRNLIKLLIKRGVTVAEFVLENEQIKQLRLSEKNKRGKSAIKVKPTTVQVIDLQSLKVAIDMVTLAYEELILDN